MIIFFLGQSIIIVGAVLGAYVGTKVQIARLEVTVSTLQINHTDISKKMHGMSRNLSELSGQVKGVK